MKYSALLDRENVVYAVAECHMIQVNVQEDEEQEPIYETVYAPSLVLEDETRDMGCKLVIFDDTQIPQDIDIFDCRFDFDEALPEKKFKQNPKHVGWRARTNIRMFRDEELVNTDFLAFTPSITEEKRQEYNEWKQRWLDAPDTLQPPLDTPEWIETILTKPSIGAIGQDRSRRKAVISNKIEDLKLLLQKEMSVEEMLEMIDIYPEWVVGVAYITNDKVRYNGKLYKVIQAHTAQADWPPDGAVSLFTEIVPEGVVPIFVQPTGAHDTYNTGDKVTFEGSVYESTIDANVWSPTVYPQGWKVLE